MKKIHLISNAHLDPVWQWNWPEGAGAALTTFGAAADFCEKHNGFIFCHNEALLYMWIEEYDNKLFKRIQKLVREKKWHIAGGWFLQPDCNMLSGESFIRQINCGLEYFKNKFKKGYERPHTALNLDSFGHTKGLVQILCDAGYSSYICTRPAPSGKETDMIWKGFASSNVKLHKGYDGYNNLLGQLDKKIEPYILKYKDKDCGLVLWGVGNHGGGPTEKDFEIIEKLKNKYPDIEFCHSVPEKYFEDIKKPVNTGSLATGSAFLANETAIENDNSYNLKNNELPVSDELNYFMCGCYTSQIRIKQMHSVLESGIVIAEKMAAHASFSGMEYPAEELFKAQYDLMFCQFHDILPGTSVKSAEESSIRILSHGLTEIERAKTRAFFHLLSDEKKAAAGEYPIFIYNPHPYKIAAQTECELSLADQNWSETEFTDFDLFCNGKKILSQTEKEESNIPLDWRKKLVFEAELEPFKITRVSCFPKSVPKTEEKIREIPDKFIFDNGKRRAVIGGNTGLIDSLSFEGKEVLTGAGSISIIKNSCDPWGFEYNSYKEKLGCFTLMTKEQTSLLAAAKPGSLPPVRIIEDGAVRTVIEACFAYKSSAAVIKYKFYKNDSRIEIDIALNNNEKDVKLKLNFPTNIKNGIFCGSTAFGVNDFKSDGNEITATEWYMLKDEQAAVSLIHSGNYGASCENGSIDCTLVNSGAYTAHPIHDRKILKSDRITQRIDQGEREFNFVLNVSDAASRTENIAFESSLAHQKPEALNCFPSGSGKDHSSFAVLDNRRVILSSLKNDINGKGYVARFFNSQNTKQNFSFQMPAINVKINGELNCYQFKTYKINNGIARECACTE